MELFRAHQQWKTRPDDQRFTSLVEMYAKCRDYASQAGTRDVAWQDIRLEAQDGDLRMIGRAGVPARLSHWALGQVAARAEAPAGYVRTLPPTLAAQVLNYGLANRTDGNASLLFHGTNGDLLVRALTSDRYTRIWNWEVVERMQGLPGEWHPARPDIRVSLGDFPALYASDHDMFAFLCTDRTVSEPGNPDGLRRGVIVENSEVGARSLRVTRFLYREMCGNHIIWGARDVVDLAIRHVGSARNRWTQWSLAVQQYANESASDQEAIIARAKSTRIAGTKDEVLDAVFGKRIPNLSRQVLEAGYQAAIPDQDGDPRTAWGLLQGITRHSQTIPYADERNAVDRAAGKLLTVNF